MRRERSGQRTLRQLRREDSERGFDDFILPTEKLIDCCSTFEDSFAIKIKEFLSILLESDSLHLSQSEEEEKEKSRWGMGRSERQQT
jgi:hypothetical protein